jgi:NADH:ubiquinone oxidoreductase subunit 4 (subunit M)
VEWVAWAPLLAAIVILGLLPWIILNVTNGTVEQLFKVFR